MNLTRSIVTDVFLVIAITILASINLGWLVFGNTSLGLIELCVFGTVGLGVFVAALRLRQIRSRVDSFRLVAQQLSGFTATDRVDSLQQVATPEKYGKGWNSLIKLLQDRQLDTIIERRIEQSGGGQKAEKLARALRSLNEGLVITDTDLNITFGNSAFAAMYAVGSGDLEEQSESFEGSSVIEVLATANYSNWRTQEENLCKGSKPLTVQLKLGRTVHEGVHQLSRLPLLGRAGESSGFVFVLRDVTQQSIARESHEQFLASATHELRTPLTNIRAYTESLLTMSNVSPERQKEFYNVIYSEAGRLGRLLNELLDIQQLEAGSMTIHTNNFEIHRMIDEVQDHLTPLLEEKDLKFTCRIPPDIKTIDADKEKITSTMINLLGNAIKYTPAGGEVSLTAESHEDTVEITVVDSGIGIAEEELPHIFDRFYRCNDERVTEVEGNGLGLAFCLEVARLHGGDLVVESQLNEGSRFTMRLPKKEKG